MLPLALAFPLAPSIVFPNTHAPMHTHTCTCTLSYSFFCPITHTYSGTCLPTHSLQTHMHRGTDASKENKCKELLHGRGKEDEARHLGMGCWFSVLRPVLCFGTDPSPFCGGGGREGEGRWWLLTDGSIPVLALLGQMSPCLSPGKTPTPHFPSVT